MNEVLTNLIENSPSGAQRLMIGLLALAALLMLYLLRIPMRSWLEERQITRAAKRIGARMMHDVNLPDGLGGMVNIDFLVLSADAIVVIGVKRYDGMIFGSARTSEWTQTIDTRSYRFPNPDIQLAQQVSAVSSRFPKATVKGLHLFTDTAMFPWDKPDNVVQVQDLLSSNTRRPGLKDVPAELRTAWMLLSNFIHH
jgi:hypothetical protein